MLCTPGITTNSSLLNEEIECALLLICKPVADNVNILFCHIAWIHVHGYITFAGVRWNCLNNVLVL